MLKVLLYTESDQADVKTIEQFIVKAGGELVAAFGGEPPPLSKLFEYGPDVVITSGNPISLVWAFLLRLKSFRLQGKEWPKIILGASPSPGRYFPHLDEYHEDEWDYFFTDPPYVDLCDISLDHLVHELGPSLAALELEHLVHTAGARKRWLLSKDQRDYGVLTYKRLKCVPLSWPRITCALEIDPSIDGMKPRLQGRSLDTFHIELKPLGDAVLVDRYLVDPNRFACDFEGEEAEILLFPTYDQDAEG